MHASFVPPLRRCAHMSRETKPRLIIHCTRNIHCDEHIHLVSLVAVVVILFLFPLRRFSAKQQLGETLLSMNKSRLANNSPIFVVLVLWLLLLYVLQLSGALSSMYCCQRRRPNQTEKPSRQYPLRLPMCSHLRFAPAFRENLEMAIY